MSETETIRTRILLAAVGALGGLAGYLLLDALPDTDVSERLILLLATFAGVFFTGTLGMVGPLKLPKSALLSLALGVLVAGLFFWASFRFDDVDGFFDSGLSFAALLVLVSVPLPFLVAIGTGVGPRDYPTLFQEAWGIVVRYAAAWLFVGVFWLVLVLSDQLLKIVGLEIIETILDVDPVPWVLTGTALGMAVAVVNELAEYLSPTLLLKLLRLFIPLVLVIVVIFIVALPFRGLSGLFGNFSAAGILMAMTLGAATLITTALDMSDEFAVTSPVMRLSSQLLALLMPVLAALAVYAVWLRVSEYGWTPERLAAGLAAALLLGYGVLYAGAVLLRQNWQERIRQANIAKAGVMVALALLWLTPVLNPERISTASQIARLEDGRTAIPEFDSWVLHHEWGVAGRARLERLAATAEADSNSELLARIDLGRETQSSWTFRNQTRQASAVDIRQGLGGKVALKPGNGMLTADDLEKLPLHELENLAEACGRKTPKGNPACVAVEANFLPAFQTRQIIMLFAPSDSGVWIRYLPLDDGQHHTPRHMTGGTRWSSASINDIDSIFDGAFSVEPLRANSVRIGDTDIFIQP